MLSSSPLLPVSSSASSWHAPAAFTTAAASLLSRAASSHSGSVRATSGYHRQSAAASASSLPSSAAMDDSTVGDMSDDAQEAEAAAATSDGADGRSLATTASAGSGLSHASAASLSSTSSLLRSLSLMPAHELQAAGVIASAPAAPPAASASKSTQRSASASASSAAGLPSLQASPASSGLRELGDECVWQLSSCKAGNGVSQLRDGQLETFWQSDGSSPHSITLHFARKTRIAALCFYVDYTLDESYTPSRMTVRAGANTSSLTDIASIELTEPTGWVTLYTLTPRQRQPQQQQRDTDTKETETAGKQQAASAAVAPAISPASFFSPSHPALHLPFARPAAAAATASSAASFLSPLSYVPIRCHYLQLLIVSSHQSGKDTHIREVKIYGPAAGVRDGSRGAGGAAVATAGPGSAQLAKQSSVALFHPVFSSIEFQSTSCIR